MELVTSLWRQDRLRGLELATLAAAECPPSEATVKKLGTYARYGARIDRDIGRALQALRVLSRRPDPRVEELQDGTSEPGEVEAAARDCTNELTPCTSEPDGPEPHAAGCTIALAAHTDEPEPANTNVEPCTTEPEPPVLNRRQRRRLAALARKQRAA